ncbi:glycosyltransferase family 2 protein [Paraburkholderia solitsugae]|nr:glycosyltransferase family 2 protein [Paraburkholderia solitsugae]
MTSSVELSIVMPCLNEAETLGACIAKAKRFLEGKDISGEVIIGDNGSTDGSQDIAKQLGARVVDIPVRGYGAALYGAVMGANGKYCIMGDSDDSYDFSRLEPFVAALREGADLVMGNRFKGGIAPGAMPWKNKYIGNPVLSGIGRLLFRPKVGDFHCGIRGFSKAAFERMDLRTRGMEFASEMVIKATLKHMNVVEVPTTLSPDGRSRPPHLRPYRDGWRHLRFMLLFSPNWLFLYPGMLLLVAGLLLGGALFPHPVTIHGVRFGIDTLIYCATMTEVGFQLLLFAVLSRMFADQEGLFPNSRWTAWLGRWLQLERGTLIGGTLVVAGVAMVFRALYIWSGTHFGALDADSFTRLVVCSSLLISTGMEFVFSSCLLSILQLNVKVSGREGGH